MHFLIVIQAINLEVTKPLAAERKTSMPTTHTNYSSDSKTQDKQSPVSQLAQLERDQKLRQEVHVNSPSCAITEIVNEEKSMGDNAKNENKIRVRFDLII